MTKKNKRYRIKEEIAVKLGLRTNKSKRYRLSEDQEKQFLKISEDELTVSSTSKTSPNNYKPKQSFVLSAWNSKTGLMMGIDEYCEVYGLPRGDITSWKLISHTGVPFYNVVFKQNFGENNQDFIESYVGAVKEAVKELDWGLTYESTSQSGNLFVPCIFDLHLGKLAWKEETGEDYDSNIAIKRFRNALEDLIQKAKGYNIDTILFPVGNDIYNSDKAKPFPQTTNGTPQMDDVRWQKMFRLGVRLITEAIIRLSKVAKVEVYTVLSNHDHERVFYLGETISAVFESHPNVTIHNSPKVRNYFQWGECLLGLAHGHNEKPDELPLIMAQENKLAWGDTFYREWLLGHYHHKLKKITQEAKDYRGVRVTYLTSPSAADAWHYEKAFTGAIKGAEGYIYNKSEGIIGSVIHNIK